MPKEKLSLKTIKQIQQKVMLEKKVKQFIDESGIPHSAYYTAVNGGKVKSEHIDRINETLKSY